MITHELAYIASLHVYFVVPLSADNGFWVVWLSLRRAKEQARPIRFENFRIGQSLSNRIESKWTVDSN